MLGDNLLVGVHQFKIDAKGRMFLPASTGREPGEGIYLAYDNELQEYAIYSQKVLDDIMRKLDEQTVLAKTSEELKFSKERLIAFSTNVTGPFKVDSQGRICLGNKFGYEGTVDIVGAYNRLVLKIPKNTK